MYLIPYLKGLKVEKKKASETYSICIRSSTLKFIVQKLSACVYSSRFTTVHRALLNKRWTRLMKALENSLIKSLIKAITLIKSAMMNGNLLIIIM